MKNREKMGLIAFLCCLILTSVGSAQEISTTTDVIEFLAESMNAHNLDPFMPYMADDFYAEHGWDNNIRDAQGFNDGWGGVFEAFPDIAFFDQFILANENFVIEEISHQGTHLKEWNSLPPTGEKGNPVRYLNVWEFEGLKLKRLMMYLDMHTVLINANVMPPMDMSDLTPSMELPAPEPNGLTPLEAATEAGNRWNAHDISSWIKMFAEDADIYNNIAGGGTFSRTENAALMETHWNGFPNASFETSRQIDLGDGWVLSEMVFTGTQTDSWFGIPATGRTYTNLKVAEVARYNSDGLCTYAHDYYDNITILSQLGLFGPSSQEDWELYR